MKTDYAHIVMGCRRHDRRAQQALYDSLAPMAMGVCMRYMQSRAEAQDVMQDGFIKVFEKIGRLRDPESLPAWVRKVMVNECLMRLREVEHHLLADDVQVEGVTLPLDPFATEEVVLALQRLAPAQRLAFNLVEVEGYTFEETADRMHSSEVNVRALLSRAKCRLRELLTERKAIE